MMMYKCLLNFCGLSKYGYVGQKIWKLITTAASWTWFDFYSPPPVSCCISFNVRYEFKNTVP